MVKFCAGGKIKKNDIKVYVFCLEEDLCNALCNACGATLSLCHSSMLWHRKRTQPCLSDTVMEQGHFLLHQTVIHSKTAVNSHPRHTLRTGTVNDINLRMTQFWKTLHTVLLLTYHLAAQVSHSHVRQVKMWWIRKVYSLTSCTQMSHCRQIINTFHQVYGPVYTV